MFSLHELKRNESIPRNLEGNTMRNSVFVREVNEHMGMKFLGSVSGYGFSFLSQKLLHPSADGSCPPLHTCHLLTCVYLLSCRPREIGSEMLSADATHVIDLHFTWHRRSDSLMKKLRLYCRICALFVVVLSMHKSTVSLG